MRRTRLALGLGLAAAVVLYVMSAAGAFLDTRPFEAAAWRAAAGDPTSRVRLEMVDDLLAAGTLTQLPAPEVLALLGPAEPRSYFSEYALMYRLGSGRGLLPSSNYLALRLDEGGRVTAARVMQD